MEPYYELEWTHPRTCSNCTALITRRKLYYAASCVVEK